MSTGPYSHEINLPAPPPGKSEVDVFGDYILKLRQALQAYLLQKLGSGYNTDESGIAYVFTTP